MSSVGGAGQKVCLQSNEGLSDCVVISGIALAAVVLKIFVVPVIGYNVCCRSSVKPVVRSV